MFFRKQTFLTPAIVATAAICLSTSTTTVAGQDLQIKATDIADVKNAAADSHQTFEKKWTVAGRDIEKLTIGAVGPVFVSYTDDKLDGIAVVRVSGDSKDLINAFQVDSRDDNDAASDDALRITTDTKPLDAKGYVLTEVMLANKAKVDVVRAQGAASVVVGENVLSSTKHDGVTIDAGGAGDVFVVANRTMAVDDLKLVLSGAGNLVLVAADGWTVTEHLNATITGAGTLAIGGSKLDAADTVVDVGGAGNVCVQSTVFTTKSLTVTAGGTGSTTFAKGGKCTTASVSTTGVGNVDVGGVACESADVSVSGSGKTVVQASTSLSVSGSGDVSYAGTKPTTVTPESGAKAASASGVGVDCQVPKPPSRAAKQVEVKGDRVIVIDDSNSNNASQSWSSSPSVAKSTTNGSSTKDGAGVSGQDNGKTSSSPKAGSKTSSASSTMTTSAVAAMALVAVVQMLW